MINNLIKDNITTDYESLRKFTMQLPQKIIESQNDLKGFIIVLDDFQLLYHMKNLEAFFKLIRTYTKKQDNVSYIFITSASWNSEILKLLNGQTGVFKGELIQIHMDALTKDETIGYVQENSEGITFSKEGFESFYNLTNGIPAYINSLCNLLPDEEECDSNSITECVQLCMDQIATPCLLVWIRLNSIEKSILLMLVKEDMNWSDLFSKTSYSKATITKYTHLLSNNGIIRYNKNKEYEIADNMLKLWLKTKYENDGVYPL